MSDVFEMLERLAAEPLIATGLRVLLILLLAYLLYRLTGIFASRILRDTRRGNGLDSNERSKQLGTLAEVARATATVLIFTIAVLMILRQLGYNITPLFGAGFLGVALGFGAQYLVRDLIGGFVILSENQYRVGDEVAANGVSGTVERIGLRATTLRNINGDTHVISNGTIELSTNMTRGAGQALVDVSVPHGERLDRVYGALESAGKELHQDAEIGDYLLGEPEIVGVVDLGSAGVTVRFACTADTSRKWTVTRSLRRRIKERFDADGISISSTRRAVDS